MVKVTIKWNRQNFDGIEVEPDLPATVFKAQLCSLTGVPPERQKIMGFKGGPLKDDADMNGLNLKDGMRLVLFGTAEGAEVQKAGVQTIFEEDLTAAQKAELLKRKEIKPLPTGLINLGNTCYLSSVMQFCKPANELSDIIKSLPDDLGSTNGDKRLCATFRKFYEAWEINDEALPPFLVVEALRSQYPQFASRVSRPVCFLISNKSRSSEGYAQQDAAECLSAILTSFSQYSTKIENIFGFKFETVMKNEECPEEPEIRKIESVTLLPCHMGTQLQAVGHLHEGIKLSLDEKLTKRSEQLGRECAYRKTMKIASLVSHVGRLLFIYRKTMKIASLPPYLVVHFVRFEWKRASDLNRTEAGRAKICRKVQFSLNFDAYDFCSDELKKQLKVGRYVWSSRTDKTTEVTTTGTLPNGSSDKQTLTSGQYELVSIVTHQGRTTDSGHYVAWTRKDEDIWYKFDDHKVSEHRWKDIDLSGGRSDYHIAVLLLYRQKVFDATAEEIKKETDKIAQETQAIEEIKSKSEQMKE